MDIWGTTGHKTRDSAMQTTHEYLRASDGCQLLRTITARYNCLDLRPDIVRSSLFPMVVHIAVLFSRCFWPTLHGSLVESQLSNPNPCTAFSFQPAIKA